MLAAAAELGLEPEIRRFPEGTRTAEQAAAAVGCELGQIVKSLVFLCAGRPVLALTSGANRVDTNRLGELLGGAITRADADGVRDATGYAIGGTPPFGHASSASRGAGSVTPAVRHGVGGSRYPGQRLRADT